MSERRKKTMEFFNKLKDPYKAKAKKNYDEKFSDVIPDSNASALFYGFSWEDSKEGDDYWYEKLLEIL